MIVLDTITNKSGSSSLLQPDSLAMNFPVPSPCAGSEVPTASFLSLSHTACYSGKRNTNDTNLSRKWSRRDRAVGCDPTVRL